jgi:D-apionolactonase
MPEPIICYFYRHLSESGVPMIDAKEIIRYGSTAALSAGRLLKSGPLTLLYESGSIRYVRYGDKELVRSIYSALRDHNWDTVEPELENEHVEAGPSSFRLHYHARYRQGPVDFSAYYEFEGDEQGNLSLRMQGVAHREFLRNRIGFCVLHPMETCKGAPCRITFTDGEAKTLEFPFFISPHQPFMDIHSMEWSVSPGLAAVLSFSGDVFETEDQRNWTDASFKTYCTPLARPFPVTVAAGEKIEQEIRFRLSGKVKNPATRADRSVMVAKRGEPLPFPRLGLGQSSSKHSLSEGEIAQLRSLNPDHLRIEWHTGSPDAGSLQTALSDARRLGWPVELVLFAAKNQRDLPRKVADLVRNSRIEVARLLLLEEGAKSCSETVIRKYAPQFRQLLPGTPYGSGTDVYFAEFNRFTPASDNLDFVCYSINPQVHAFDLSSMTETLGAQRETVESACVLAPEKEVVVSPVTLKPRYNPNATAAAPEPLPGQLPPEVDPRQMSLYAAGWTVGSIANLAAGGASSITYYETTGWRGVIQGDRDPVLPGLFHARAGQRFPVCFVLQQVTSFPGRAFQPAVISEHLSVSALWMENTEGGKILVANHVNDSKTVEVALAAGPATVQTFDADAALRYMNTGTLPPRRKARRSKAGIRIDLQPFSIAVINYKSHNNSL